MSHLPWPSEDIVSDLCIVKDTLGLIPQSWSTRYLNSALSKVQPFSPKVKWKSFLILPRLKNSSSYCVWITWLFYNLFRMFANHLCWLVVILQGNDEMIYFYLCFLPSMFKGGSIQMLSKTRSTTGHLIPTYLETSFFKYILPLIILPLPPSLWTLMRIFLPFFEKYFHLPNQGTLTCYINSNFSLPKFLPSVFHCDTICLLSPFYL